MNKYPLLSKVLVIGTLMLVLAIPLLMVRGVIEERTANRAQATEEVARAHAGAQTIVGPVLYVPYTETFMRTVIERGATRDEQVVVTRAVVRFPVQMNTRSELATETRWRGIFPVAVYNSGHESKGHFVWRDPVAQEKGGQIALGQPRLLMGVSDLRGLQSTPRLAVAGQALTVTSSPVDGNLPLPLAASVDAGLLKTGATIPFSMGMDLAGTGRIGWVPLADETTVDLSSAWPHPSFGGQFLPRSRHVTDQGFKAQWRVPALSTQAQKQFMQKAERQPTLENFSVALSDPVDVYRLTDRAAKYAMMFIVLTFAAFFVLEMVRRWRIHPMQYLMIGAALVLFFLMLLSLAEQLGFVWAYLLASLGCVGLLTYYLRHVLHGWQPAAAVGTLLTALYGVLYGILVSEDNALMMGSLLLFGVLAGIMVATRKLDWYSVMSAPAARSNGMQREQAATPVG